MSGEEYEDQESSDDEKDNAFQKGVTQCYHGLGKECGTKINTLDIGTGK